MEGAIVGGAGSLVALEKIIQIFQNSEMRLKPGYLRSIHII